MHFFSATIYSHHHSVLPKGRSFTGNSGTKAAVLPKVRSSTANSGTKVSVLLGMNGCCTSPFSVDVRNHQQCCISWSLDWKGRPTRSPDLNPLHYFPWEYLKSLVFETPEETDMELVATIVAACDIIKNNNLSNCCKMQNGTLIVSMYCMCR